jgi:hypothetical protein
MENSQLFLNEKIISVKELDFIDIFTFYEVSELFPSFVEKSFSCRSKSLQSIIIDDNFGSISRH